MMVSALDESPKETTDAQIASGWLKQGDVLACPTECVWGIGCDAYSQHAAEKIFAIKQRPVAKGLIVITDQVSRLAPLIASLPDAQRQSIVNSWEYATDKLEDHQAYTWLLPLAESHTMPEWLTGQHRSIAVRVTPHPLLQSLCAQLVSANNPYGFMVSTSCNPSGQPPAINFIQAKAYFGSQISYLQGPTLGYALPSQIKDGLTGQIIR